ncbi:hypothetical protein B0T21DRAFT_411687 [Apiosordaria backusii]|uniref:DUF7770 domain-containing protein n=1 Tax=Apiosordaria backusii TaxID=314023 RepID=A0AA40BLT7_9PEZI|nr:hypothetical protein B0T21DRAFT_411687 [Apiosordaria backusii]
MTSSSTGKSTHYNLIYDTLPDNGIPPDTPFLSWPVAKVHHDTYNLGPIFEDDGTVNGSKNHWVMVLECPSVNGQVRVSMDSKKNTRHGHFGTTVTRQFTVGHFLDRALASGWHSYRMACDARGGYKGCQHHLRIVTQGLIRLGWVAEKSDDGLTMDQYLNFNYFIDDDLDVNHPNYLTRNYHKALEAVAQSSGPFAVVTENAALGASEVGLAYYLPKILGKRRERSKSPESWRVRKVEPDQKRTRHN